MGSARHPLFIFSVAASIGDILTLCVLEEV